MKLSVLLSLAVLATFAAGHGAHAQVWDSKGWVKLGERTVNGKVDRDRIEVGAVDGKFTKVTLVVERSEIELLDFEVTFGDGEHFHADTKHYFREGSRTRVIDLPGKERVIKAINLHYRNIPGGGPAKVEVWGWRAGAGTAVSPAFSWDSNGWTMLGERTVNGRVDHDRIEVGRGEGKFKKLTVVVMDSDLEMIDFEIKFAKGQPWHPALSHYFKEGQRTRVIDFPGDERVIKFIDFKYRNLPGGGAAKVQVWAK